MENKYDITIVIPFYYGNKYICNLLEKLNKSACFAENLKIETLIVNDSPDCQIDFINYSNLNISVITNSKNMGIHYSRVAGIMNAQGKYIIMLDQDDELSEKALLLQYDGIKDNVILDICEKIMKFAANKNIQIQRAAKSYYVTGALRVYLNAPDTAEYQEVIYKAKNILNSYGKKVLKDKNIRKKNRYSLYLYFYLRPLLKLIYQKIDRWK